MCLFRFFTIILRYFSFIFLLIFFVSSCSSVPKPTGYQYSTMQKMQSVAHWQILADNIAKQISIQMQQMPVKQGASLYLEEKEGVFNEVFRKLLIVSLVEMSQQKGSSFTVSTSKDKSYILQVDTQVVRHRADRMQQLPPGTITIAGTLVKVLYDIGSSASDLIIPVAALVDIGVSSYASLSNNEVVITSSIRDGDTYLFTRSDLYYINDNDTDHYETGVAGNVATRTFAGEELAQ